MGEVPVFAGESLRLQRPPPDAYARFFCAQPGGRRQTSWGILRELGPPSLISSSSWKHAPRRSKLALSAKAVARARPSVWEVPTRADVADPGRYEEGPRIYAPLRCEDAAEMGPCIPDFEDYGRTRDWSSFSDAVAAGGFPGADSSTTWLPARAVHARATGRCEGVAPRSVGTHAGINPYDANPGQRFQIACPPNYPWMGEAAPITRIPDC